MSLSIKRSHLVFALVGLSGCAIADGTVQEKVDQWSSIDQPILCPPDSPCGGNGPRNPGDPPDPPPPPPTWYYPATGWTVINASESNVQRGVQWWAYSWEGNRLNVKAYYPTDFGTGIPHGAEPAHAFLTFEVTSPIEWRAWSHVNLPRWWGTKEQSGYVQSYLDGNGVVTQYATQGYSSCNGDVCETRDYSGIYQDDGTGPVLVQGSDALTSVGGAIVFSFLNDLRASGGGLAPPGADPSYCADDCLNGLRLYLERQQQYLRSLTANWANLDNPPYIACGAAGASTAVCGFAALVAYSGWWLPPAWLTGATIATICFFAASADITCGAAIESYDPPPAGTCVISVVPTVVTGPDGRTTTITYQVHQSQSCNF
jgi:hypothetical protein